MLEKKWGKNESDEPQRKIAERKNFLAADEACNGSIF